MVNTEDLYCKIYVNANCDRQELIERIAKYVAGDVDMNTVSTLVLEIDIRKNEDFNGITNAIDSDSFLHFKFYLDVVPKNECVNIKFYKRTISELLEHFWADNNVAVAACDFEEELPKGGGYRCD